MNKNFLFTSVLTCLFTFVEYQVNFFTGINIYTFGFLVFLFCYPWKIGKDVWSMFGGWNNEEDGSVNSIFGIFQSAKKNTVQIFGLSLYQNAGRDAIQGVGFALFQKAGRDANQFFGFALFQNAERDANQFFGFALFQNAERDADQGFGFALFQKAEKDAIQTVGFRVLVFGNKINKTFTCLHVYHKPLELYEPSHQ